MAREGEDGFGLEEKKEYGVGKGEKLGK